MQHQEQDQTTQINLRKDEWIGRTVAGKYEITDLLGKGGMSSVYKAKHIILGRVYALKMMHQHMVTDANALIRFRQEAAAASALNHPNIIHVHDYATENDQPFQAIDYLKGTSLAEEIRSVGQLEPERAVQIFVQAASALAHAHEKGVIHRDLKPSNIMLIEENGVPDVVKLVDFGIAKMLPQEGQAVQQLTQTGEIFGSPLYMSPEQCLGQKLDARSDIYSMGCLMYETLTGKPPLLGGTVFATIQKHIDETPKSVKEQLPPSRLVEALDLVVSKALAKAPEHRYQSMDELLKELLAVQQGTTGTMFKSFKKSMEVARIRLEPVRKRTPMRLVIPLAVTFCLLFVAMSVILQMVTASVPPFRDMPWPAFSTEAANVGLEGRNDEMMRWASITVSQFEDRAAMSARSGDVERAAHYSLSLLLPFAKNGDYAQAAKLAPELRERLQNLETAMPKYDELKLFAEGTTRVDTSEAFTFIADACYVTKNFAVAEWFYHKAIDQLAGNADHLHQRIYLKLGDCAWNLHEWGEANKYWHEAAKLKGDQEFGARMFNTGDAGFSQDRASWMGKMGDMLMERENYKTAELAYAGAAAEWSKQNTEGLAGQAYYKLAVALIKLNRPAEAEAALNKAIKAFNDTPMSDAKDNLPAVYEKLAELLKQRGQMFDAFKLEQEALSLNRQAGH